MKQIVFSGFDIIYLFSCLEFKKARPKDIEKHVSPSQQDAELFLKIMEFILTGKKRKKLLEKLTKGRLFKAKISEEKWKKFLKKHAEELVKEWSEFKPSQHFFWNNAENRLIKLTETWEKHMKKLSPARILTIHIKGVCR